MRDEIDWSDHEQEFMINPALVRLRRGPHVPSWIRMPALVAEPDVLFVAEQPERVDSRLHGIALIESGLMGVSALTFLHKYPGYMTGPEKAASRRYAEQEIVRLQPKVLVAMGSEPLKFCTREDDAPPVAVCHGDRFTTPKGRPVIAALPPTPVFAFNRVKLAYETAEWTLRHLDGEDFSNG